MTDKFKAAADLLEAHNAWRRGADGDDRMQNVRALGEAIDTAIAALRSAAPAVALQEPEAWRDPTNTDPGQAVVFSRWQHEAHPHIFRQALYATPPSPAEVKVEAAQVAAVPNTFKLPGETDDAWIDRITGAGPALSQEQAAPWPREADLLTQAIQRINSRPHNLTKVECLHVISQLRAEQQAAPQHPDDAAVDRFAGHMKWKLASARDRGRSGWQDRAWMPAQISQALREHVEKGDPTDVANYCMFLQARGEPICPAAPQDGRQERAAPRDVSKVPAAEEVPHEVWVERVACARVADAFAHESGVGDRRYSGNVISARILARTSGRVAAAPVPAVAPVQQAPEGAQP